MTEAGNTAGFSLRKALRLLEHALEGRVAVMPAERLPPGSGELLVTLERAPNPPLAVRLVPWRQGEERPGEESIVWVLGSRDRAAVPRLRQREESYVDLRGAVHLVLPWLLVDRTDMKPPRSAGASPTANPFSDRNSLVVRTLLADPDRAWGVRSLAAAAGVSPGTASKVVRRLASDGLVDVVGAAVRAKHPRRLLRRWTRGYDWQRNPASAFHAPVGDVDRFLRRLDTVFGGARWALTLHAGASRVAPLATWEKVHVYVDAEAYEDTLDTMARAGWTLAADGRVVLMKPYYRASVWHGVRTVRGVSVVSDLQLVLDLWEYPVRGREQAEHLLDTLLFPHHHD